MGRIDRKRRQQRKDMHQKMLFQRGTLLFGDIRTFDQDYPLFGEFLAQCFPACLLIESKARGHLVDARELFAGRQTLRALGSDARAHMAFQTGDAHHEEFVQVVGRDRKKAYPLKQGMVLVLGLFQNPAIKLQPGQFPVDKPIPAGGFE